MFAIVAISGKQHRVTKGQRLVVDRLEAKDGAELSLNEVLLTSDGAATSVGQPYVTGAVVKAKVVGQRRGPKIRVVKYKPKVRYRKVYGHRQAQTELVIADISAPR